MIRPPRWYKINERYVRLFLLALSLFAIVTFFSYVVYPSIGDFDYWHMRVAAEGSRTGHIDPGYSTPGFAAFTIMLSGVTGIGYETIPSLPLQLLPFFFALAALFRRAGRSKLLCAPLAVAFLTWSSVPTTYTWGNHDLGAILLLMMILVAIMRIDRRKSGYHLQTSIILLATVAAVNFMSYKLTLVSIAFLACLHIMILLDRRRSYPDSLKLKRGFTLVTLIGLCFVLAYNKFLYDEFIPILRVASEFSYSSGLDKVLGFFFVGKSDSLSQFYWRTPPEVYYVKAVWLGIVFLVLLLGTVAVFRKLWSRVPLSQGEIVLAAFLPAVVLLSIVYNSLGLVDFTYFVVGAFIALSALPFARSRLKTVVVVIGLVVLIIINAYVASETMASGNYAGQKSPAVSLDYCDPLSDWYVAHGGNTVMAADVLTIGCFMISMEEKHNSTDYNIGVFSIDQMMFILDRAENRSESAARYSTFFLINLNLKHFEAFGWGAFESWSANKLIVDTNPNLSVIYSSGGIEILYSAIP